MIQRFSSIRDQILSKKGMNWSGTSLVIGTNANVRVSVRSGHVLLCIIDSDVTIDSDQPPSLRLDSSCYLFDGPLSWRLLPFSSPSTNYPDEDAPLRCRFRETARIPENCLVLCSLGQSFHACKLLVTFCQLNFWANGTEFRLHGITCCQVIWYFRTQSNRSSKSMKALVRYTIKINYCYR